MTTTTPKANSKQALEQLQHEAETLLAPLGYEIVALENSSAGGRVFTLFIDFLHNADEKRRVGLDDCVTANKAVDELFENTPLLREPTRSRSAAPASSAAFVKPKTTIDSVAAR